MTLPRPCCSALNTVRTRFKRYLADDLAELLQVEYRGRDVALSEEQLDRRDLHDLKHIWHSRPSTSQGQPVS